SNWTNLSGAETATVLSRGTASNSTSESGQSLQPGPGGRSGAYVLASSDSNSFTNSNIDKMTFAGESATLSGSSNYAAQSSTAAGGSRYTESGVQSSDGADDPGGAYSQFSLASNNGQNRNTSTSTWNDTSGTQTSSSSTSGSQTNSAT